MAGRIGYGKAPARPRRGSRPALSLALAICACTAAGCAWVKLTPEGENVQVAEAGAVTNCVRNGKVTVSLKNRVAGFERKPTKVAGELATLARNEGALLGGDTVVAESNVADGRQVFGVYQCRQ